jgi:fused signal recognition particle receptor
LFRSIRESLSRTRQSVFGQLANVLGIGEITLETWDDLEALLIQADIGVETSLDLVEALKGRVEKEGLYRADQLLPALKDELRQILVSEMAFELEAPRQLTVVMVVGVNGSGKTTSIGKLAHYYQQKGRRLFWPRPIHSALRPLIS